MSFLRFDFKKLTLLESGRIFHGLDEDTLLDITQYKTLQYFVDYAHPLSGMIRERSNASPAYDHYQTVTTGGTGFGIMAMIAGVERGWMTKDDFAVHVSKIAGFLERVKTHHGVFPHFLHGGHGETVPFSEKDDGGDIVETSFLMMGLLCAREYLDDTYSLLKGKINKLWSNVEWDHHVRPEKGDFVWHWSPKYGYDMDHKLAGWNECLLPYVLGAGAPEHFIDPSLYHDVWAKGKEFYNGESIHGHRLQLGPEYGGPLFLSHYSFLGINPKGLEDRYADYWEQNVAHTMINHKHCTANPFRFEGYNSHCWGLTASDSTPFDGRPSYRAHSPTNDYGVISPTAALSAMPYTPKESLQALRHFYEDRGDKIFGRYGFADAFHAASGWTSDSHLAIDQGPIMVMIENYRSGLLWKLGMSLPEVRKGLDALGFQSDKIPPKTAHVPIPA